MWKFLLSPRWIGLAAFAVFIFCLSIWAGGWQHDRWENRKADNALIEANQSKPAVPVESLGPWNNSHDWRKVSATGVFDPTHQVTVRYQQRDSTPGVNVVTPLRLSDGGVVLIDRGWIEGPRNGEAPDDVPPPPSGTVTVEGWLQADAHSSGQATTPTAGQVRAVNSSSWTSFLGAEALPGYIAMTSPEQAGLAPGEDVDLGTGPHLFYSIQWYIFAAMAVFGYVWFVRIEVKERRQARLTSSA